MPAAPVVTLSKPSAVDMPTPWWRVSMMWLVIGGPLSVVIASVISAVLAWQALDPVLSTADPTAKQAAQTPPKSALAPAMKGRNHAATPVP